MGAGNEFGFSTRTASAESSLQPTFLISKTNRECFTWLFSYICAHSCKNIFN